MSIKNGYIVSGSDDKTIKIWDNGEQIKELKGHSDSVKSLCEIDENHIASASFDKTIKIWDLNKDECIQTLNEHLDKVICIIYHSDGYIISCSKDKKIIIWERSERSERSESSVNILLRNTNDYDTIRHII